MGAGSQEARWSGPEAFGYRQNQGFGSHFPELTLTTKADILQLFMNNQSVPELLITIHRLRFFAPNLLHWSWKKGTFHEYP